MSTEDSPEVLHNAVRRSIAELEAAAEELHYMRMALSVKDAFVAELRERNAELERRGEELERVAADAERDRNDLARVTRERDELAGALEMMRDALGRVSR